MTDHQHNTLAISWRNPDTAPGHFDLDTYAQAVLEARDAVSEITGQASLTGWSGESRAGGGPTAVAWR